MIKKVISDIVKIPLIDSAVETAKEVHNILKDRKMVRHNRDKPVREFFVSDSPRKFAHTGKKFLGHGISKISKITVGG